MRRIVVGLACTVLCISRSYAQNIPNLDCFFALNGTTEGLQSGVVLPPFRIKGFDSNVHFQIELNKFIETAQNEFIAKTKLLKEKDREWFETVFIPESKEDYYVKYLNKPGEVYSKLLSELSVDSRNHLRRWTRHSLAYLYLDKLADLTKLGDNLLAIHTDVEALEVKSPITPEFKTIALEYLDYILGHLHAQAAPEVIAFLEKKEVTLRGNAEREIGARRQEYFYFFVEDRNLKQIFITDDYLNETVQTTLRGLLDRSVQAKRTIEAFEQFLVMARPPYAEYLSAEIVKDFKGTLEGLLRISDEALGGKAVPPEELKNFFTGN